MLVKTYSCVIRGIEAVKISIEVNITQGIRFMIVGLADSAIRESQQRIESALTQTGFDWPRFRVVINLAPADIRKEGTHFDLPLAVGILAATRQLTEEKLGDYMILGELSLDGRVVPVKGILPMALNAREQGLSGVIIPAENAGEAEMVEGIDVIPVEKLHDAVAFLNGTDDSAIFSTVKKVIFKADKEGPELDFSEVKGQEGVKRALLIAAAGNHNVLMLGPPGSGKTMLATRLPGIMPPISLEEALQTTKIHSVAGRTGKNGSIVTRRPFRAPHHSSSDIALIGGGSSPQPGEISLAHNGVLFLDELPEFKRHVLEVLRQPLEDREIHVSRANYSVVYPASFMLVAAMNPCPCGFYTHTDRQCSCGPGDIRRYLARISGPLLDRIDIQIEVLPVSFGEMSEDQTGESSASMREKVLAARRLQERRFAGIKGIYSNAQMNSRLMRMHCRMDGKGRSVILKVMKDLQLSARAYDRILKVSRTIADLDGCGTIMGRHVTEATGYRNLDREGWAG